MPPWPRHPDLLIAELADSQHGVVTRGQLLAAGLTDEMVRARLATRRLYRLHAGVYSLTRHPGQWGLFMAAVLACGPAAVLSHRSALALWDLRAQSSGPVHITVPRGRAAGDARICLHKTRSLDLADIATVHAIPCTDWPRTIVDCAARASERDIRRLLERTQVLGLFDRRALDDVLARSNGRTGTGKVRRVLADLADGPPPTRSELERRFLDLVRRAGLPLPVTNGLVHGHEVDFHWPEHRVIVETDGRATHGIAFAFERDRRRDLDLALADWRVIRITWRQLRDEPERVVAALRRALAAGAAR